MVYDKRTKLVKVLQACNSRESPAKSDTSEVTMAWRSKLHEHHVVYLDLNSNVYSIRPPERLCIHILYYILAESKHSHSDSSTASELYHLLNLDRILLEEIPQARRLFSHLLMRPLHKLLLICPKTARIIDEVQHCCIMRCHMRRQKALEYIHRNLVVLDGLTSRFGKRLRYLVIRPQARSAVHDLASVLGRVCKDGSDILPRVICRVDQWHGRIRANYVREGIHPRFARWAGLGIVEPILHKDSRIEESALYG